jgi:hypothetical protein
MDSFVADTTDDQGLPTTRGHHLSPSGLCSPPPNVQILQVSNVMHFNTVMRSAHLASVSKQALHNLVASTVPHLRRLIVEPSNPDLSL